MTLVRWVDAYFAFQSVQKTLSTLQGVKENQQVRYDTDTQTFSAIPWTQWRAPLTGDLVQGLDATITRACELYDYFRQNYAGLRGWPQHKLREERVNLHEKAGLCLKFGFKHLAETYRTENEQVSLQFSRLKQILKQAEEPAAAREPRIDDLEGFVQDLGMNTRKSDPRFNHLLREEAKKWIEKTGLFTRKDEVIPPGHLRLFLDFFLEWQLEEFDSRIDRLCALNRSGKEEGRKELTAEIAAILGDFTKAETLYQDLLDPEKLQEFTTCRLIGKVAKTMTETSRKSQKAACEIAEQCDEILQGLLGTKVEQIDQTDEEDRPLQWNLGVVVSEKLVTECVADGIRKAHLNYEGVITAYNQWRLFERHVEGFFWGSYNFEPSGEIKEGEVRCPARSNDRSGLYHFWSRENFSTSSHPIDLKEFTDLFRYLRTKKGEPLIIQFEHTWAESTQVEQVRSLFDEAEEKSIPHFTIPLVPSQIWDKSREHNIKGLALLLYGVLPLLKEEDFKGLCTMPEVESSLGNAIHARAQTIEEANVKIDRPVREILDAYIRTMPPDTHKHHKGHTALLAIKTLYEGDVNPLLQTELLLLTGICLGGPMHAMDANGLDRSGIARALWEALWQMKEVKKCTAYELYEVIKFLSTDEGAADLWRCHLDASLQHEKKNQKKPLQSLEQDYDNTPPAGEVRFAACLSEQILAKDREARPLFERAVAYCSFYTAALIKTGGILQLLGTGVVGAKFNHDSKGLLNRFGMAYTNPWAEKRLLPFVETERGNLIQLFDPSRGTYTPAGMDIIHRLSQCREKDFKYVFTD